MELTFFRNTRCKSSDFFELFHKQNTSSFHLFWVNGSPLEILTRRHVDLTALFLGTCSFRWRGTNRTGILICRKKRGRRTFAGRLSPADLRKFLLELRVGDVAAPRILWSRVPDDWTESCILRDLCRLRCEVNFLYYFWTFNLWRSTTRFQSLVTLTCLIIRFYAAFFMIRCFCVFPKSKRRYVVN